MAIVRLRDSPLIVTSATSMRRSTVPMRDAIMRRRRPTVPM